jgi:hypothetical protein
MRCWCKEQLNVLAHQYKQVWAGERERDEGKKGISRLLQEVEALSFRFWSFFSLEQQNRIAN